MTDKQKIIDGVDVSGCEHFNDSGNYNCRGCRRCEDNPKCHYKQLKAKEQECEELKEARKNSRCAWKSIEGTFCSEAQEQLDQLKEQLEAEKNWHKTADEISKANSEYTAKLKADNKHLNGLLDQALKELEEHREAFEKVRELIQKEIADCEHCDDCTNCEYNCCTRQILQICDEVKDV